MPLLPFFFPAAPTSSRAGVDVPLFAPDGAAQGLLTGVLRPLLSRVRARPVYPGLKSVLVGFAAAGRAGKASAPTGFLFTFVDDATRDGMGEGRALVAADEEAQGVCPGFAPTRPAGAGRAGKGLLDDAFDQLACRLAVDRDDLAVELFNFSTREPPRTVDPPFNACSVAEPGSEG